MPVLNPNHPVMRQMDEQYYKLLCAHMLKYGEREWNVTEADVRAIEGRAIVIDTRGGGLVVRIIDDKDAEGIARAEGGLVF